MDKVTVKVDASREVGKQNHLWRYIGYDECNYTYVPEGIELLKKFGSLGDAPYFVRTHFMFCTGNCLGTFKFGSTNVYSEDYGIPVYDFEYYDRIVGAILETGNKPFLELGFMPMDLVDTNYLRPVNGNWDSYNQYKEIGWTCPPKDYDKWHEFIRTLVSHLCEKYGEKEVESWYFELWNEPDIFYWSGTAAEYCKLYDYTEDAFHKVLPNGRLCGPAVTGIFKEGHARKFFEFFLEHCKEGTNFLTGEKGSRLDFISFHVKGGGFPFQIRAPKAVPSVESLVFQVDMGLSIMNQYGFGDRKVVLSEADPDGWAAGGIHDNANMRFRNTEYYATYVASAFEKIDQLSRKYNTRINPLSWAFMFPGERCFEGTRTFSTQGIDKAVFNLFKIYGQLGDKKLAFESDGAEKMDFLNEPDIGTKNASSYTGEGEKTDVSGFAVRGADGETQILVYSHNNDIDLHETSEVELEITGLDADKVCISHMRIDADHSNAYKEYLKQGSPLFPDGEVYDAIKAKDKLEKMCEDQVLDVTDHKITVYFVMPTHAISYLTVKKA